jgi:hypothetical protein
MIRKTQKLAVGAFLALLSGGIWSLAADKPWSESENDRPKATRSRSAAGRITVPVKRTPLHEGSAPRNYYQELFANGESTDEPDQKPAASKRFVPVRTNLLEKPRKVASDAAPRKPAEEVQNTSDDWSTIETSAVRSAEFDERRDDKFENKIEHVRVETRPKSRIPLPPSRHRSSPITTSVSHALEPAAPPVASNGPLASGVSLEWVKKSEFNVGQECVVELVVKNTGASTVEQVAVDAIFQAPVRLTSAQPQPNEGRDRLSWNIDALPAGAEQRIVLKLIPGRRGDLGLKAQVRLTGTAAATFRVEEPQLKVALKGPTEVMLGDSASQMVLVSNPGTGAAQDVCISAKVTSGLEHARGERETIEMEIGTIMPGESRTIRLPLTGVQGGEHSVSITANTSSDVSHVASATIHVISPSLAIDADGPALRYKGRNAKFTAKVANDGSVANNNVRVLQAVGEGFEFVSADHGGKYDPAQRTISWFLGRLEPDQVIEVGCELTAIEIGDFTQKISVASDAGARAETTLDTTVDGVASLTMELVDLDDPVEVGVETAYEIRIKNGGSKAATNVKVSCDLPSNVKLLSAKGPTDALAEGRTLTFKPLPQLAPGQDSVFRVHVQGVQDGNQRVKARVTSDTLSDPLVQEEPTKFYSDARR